MNILFVNNWGIYDSLSVSTTYPSLEVLDKSESVDQIFLVSPEHQEVRKLEKFEKVLHFPVNIGLCRQPSLFKYICYEVKQKKVLEEIVHKYKIDKIIARGAQAGGRVWKLAQKYNIPFFVESFEPHSEYMLESGVWSSYDPRYLIQKYWEKNIIKYAKGIMPVAQNYKQHLVSLGVDKHKIQTIPCSVDIEHFSFKQKFREKIREELDIPKDSIVGIYVGKFGDIYYGDEAFEIFDHAFKTIENFHLILLSPLKELQLKEKIKTKEFIDITRVHLRFVQQSEVTQYLSSADFAYEFHLPKPNTLYCSPIKIGEYWASGLPIVISKGVGDDAKIIQEEKIGVIIDPDNKQYDKIHLNILDVISSHNRDEIASFAQKYRSRERIIDGYKALEII